MAPPACGNGDATFFTRLLAPTSSSNTRIRIIILMSFSLSAKNERSCTQPSTKRAFDHHIGTLIQQHMPCPRCGMTAGISVQVEGEVEFERESKEHTCMVLSTLLLSCRLLSTATTKAARTCAN